MDIAFFHHADSCGMEDAMTMMGESMDDHHCCDDESFTIEGQDTLQLTWDDLELESQIFLFSFADIYLTFLFVPLGNEIQRDIYPPPLLVQDLTILHEVFLI